MQRLVRALQSAQAMTPQRLRKVRRAGFGPLPSLVAWTVVLALPTSVWAQPRFDQPSAAVVVSPISRDQVETFATMVGDDPYVVWQILIAHPDIVSTAVAAGKARTERRRTGTALIVAGFSALGAGVIWGLLEALSAPLICFDDPECRERQDRAEDTGQTIALVGALVGMALAVPGFVTKARESEAEVEAVRQYRRWRPQIGAILPREPPRYSGPGLAPRSFSVPLVSLTF